VLQCQRRLAIGLLCAQAIAASLLSGLVTSRLLYPKNTLGQKGTGMWVGEALIDRTGAVTKVWPLRTPSFEPAWPAFNESIVAAIRQWKYAPTLVGGVATPVCMVVTVNIDWR
jgi:hypothetical protein